MFFDRGLSEEFAWRCKQAGQLASKMRLSALAGHAAGRCVVASRSPRQPHGRAPAEGLCALPGVSLISPATPTESSSSYPAPAVAALGMPVWSLHLHRRRRPLHVLLGHERRGSR